MRLKLTILFFLLLFSGKSFSKSNLDSLLYTLDETIEKHEVYNKVKEARIEKLRQTLYRTHSLSEAYELNRMLYLEYRPYTSDSAIFYLNKNIELATKMNDTERLDINLIHLSRLLGASGMYKEATDIIHKVNRKELSSDLLPDYYECLSYIYYELYAYTQENNSKEHYQEISKAYTDSLYKVINSDSKLYLSMKEKELRENHQLEEAKKLNTVRLQQTQFGTPEYAMITFQRALIYKQEGNREKEKSYLCLSSLSDIQSSHRDHASLWTLAQLLYEDGDIERAYRYIRFSRNETSLYNARLRDMQSAGPLSLIDKTYHALIEEKNEKLQNYLILISLLGVMLFIALLFIYRQMKKLAVARNNLQEVNGQLKALNSELKDMNTCLQSTNIELSESNKIKEEYIGRFIKLCSTYIDKLDGYRRMVNKRISHGETEALLKITRSQDALNKEVEELYINFDSAFLQLFPNFVNDFNELLQKDDPIELKKGELLNTELRIFALIRLGIDNSSQIAEFLRYSVNTIYNYRAKVKNRARGSRDDFENLVKMIR